MYKRQGTEEYRPTALHNFSLYLDGRWYSLTAREGRYNDADPIGVLDVTISSDLILRDLLDSLAASTDLWEQRIAVVSTLALIRKGQYADTLRIATTLLSHPHTLIHKAIGWMLREIGKRDIDTLRRYLAEHYSELPRTSLRYAIERMEEDERRHWLYGYGKPTK